MKALRKTSEIWDGQQLTTTPLDRRQRSSLEKSYHSVTVDEDLRARRRPEGKSYHFYDSKGASLLRRCKHFWQTVAKPGYEKHFSRANPPLVRIRNFLNWIQALQRESFANRKGAWMAILYSGLRIRRREPMVSDELCEIEAAELFYFESAVRDALDQDIIEPSDPRAEALSLRAAVRGFGTGSHIERSDELSA